VGTVGKIVKKPAFSALYAFLGYLRSVRSSVANQD
jgi:hypothetical protein